MIPFRSSGSAPRSRRLPSGRAKHGVAFTLIEVLAAMSVLLLVILLATKLFDGALRATTQSHRQMDVGSEARLVFDRFGEDFSAMVRRADVDSKFDKKPGSDAMAFYAETMGYTAYSTGLPRTLATLDYRIHLGNGSPDTLRNYKLERGARGMAYNEMLFSDPPTPYAKGSQTYVAGFSPFNTLPSIAADDYTVIGDQIFRLEFCYLLKNGRLSKTPNPPDDLNGYGGSGYRPDPHNFQQVAALVVAVVMLDARSRTLLGDPKSPGYLDALAHLAAAFPDVDPNPDAAGAQDILSVWQPQLAKITARQDASTANLPQPVLGNLHALQRYYYWK